MKDIKDWSEEYKAPMTKDYQQADNQFAGNQFGTTLNYMKRQDKIQEKAAGKVKQQNYKGRYE